MPVVPNDPQPEAALATVPTSRPGVVRWIRGGRSCPVCCEPHCSTPVECADEALTYTWLDCTDCAGSGFDTTGYDIWCQECGGAGVVPGGCP